MPPSVSIGLPVFNGEEFLDETIGSIAAQTYADFELVICDNASTDSTPDIIDKWVERDARIRSIRSTENVGANRNYNRAFRHSTGSLFKWAAHDDLLAETYLEQCVDVLAARPEVVLVHSEAELIDRTGQPLLRMRHVSLDGDGYVEGLPDPAVYYEHLASPDPVRRFAGSLRHLTYAFPIFGLIRRDALFGTRLFRDFYGADKVLLAELALAGPFALVDEPLWLRRCHRNTSTRNRSRVSQRIWSDPGAVASFYPLDMARGYADAIRSSELPAGDRRRAQLELAKKMAEPGKWRQMLIPGSANFLGWGA